MRMSFEYGQDTNYREHVKIYTNILGQPCQTRDTSLLKKSVWDDCKTRFEYMLKLEDDKLLIYAALYDKELWGE